MTTSDQSGPEIDPANVDFDSVYRGEGMGDIPFTKPPWDIGAPQPQVVELEQAGSFSGRILDAGCGTGDNAIFLTERGYAVTGVDGAPTAIEIASQRASDRGVDVPFVVADATELDGFEQEFDTVLDSALYHCLPESARTAYVSALHRVTKPGARLHLLCFADVDGGFMPTRISKDELRANFAEHWQITDIDLVRYSGGIDPETAAQLSEQFEGIGLDQMDTDDQGRTIVPMWHLQAQRA